MVETLRAALQKLETRVAVLEKSPAPAAVPCAKVGDQQLRVMFTVKVCPKEAMALSSVLFQVFG